MNNIQHAHLLISIHKEPIKKEEIVSRELSFFNLSKKEIESQRQKIIYEFNNGIKVLNSNQLKNLIDLSKQKFSREDIGKKLNFYEIDNDYHENIFQFLKNYQSSIKPIDVHKLDSNFKGIQVASRDDFNMIINKGYTGDWVINPKSIKHMRVQVASMNETGSYSRGYYLNADIKEIKAIEYEDQIRYRIFITNPVIINTGNRNVKFKNNPVHYID